MQYVDSNPYTCWSQIVLFFYLKKLLYTWSSVFLIHILFSIVHSILIIFVWHLKFLLNSELIPCSLSTNLLQISSKNSSANSNLPHLWTLRKDMPSKRRRTVLTILLLSCRFGLGFIIISSIRTWYFQNIVYWRIIGSMHYSIVRYSRNFRIPRVVISFLTVMVLTVRLYKIFLLGFVMSSVFH